MPMLPYSGVAPSIAQGAYVAPNAYVIGDVTVGSGSGIWFGCTVRGDVAYVRIGENTNIQDGTVIHVTRGGHPTIIGNGVTVGHKALLHACRLEDACFIGMGAIVMDDAVVETGAMVAAGALVTPGKRVPTGEIWAGNPARFFRMLTSAETTHIAASRDNYVAHVREYLSA